ncbi:protein max [Biomphalaria glabrata]|uniref:Protein max-like n=2 Tax=Biomphalaria TaxID=6525 RepID=A0A2C9KYT2_BIOGL|nr:protein max-like [Biomphalaria glabrata]KAI8735273.1 protein max-like [Biomphalaria glabrata]KAI8784553.1 protein max [Biomphalaria glabrata]KAK0059788.1 protein max [Biomphalaria pfeifferi]
MSMSDEDREIDIESDADDEESPQTFSSDDKRAHHNALERKRRDHIKDSFHSLRDCVPQDDTKTNTSSKTSRAQILRQAAEYIIRMRDKTMQNDRHINILKQQNDDLQSQIKALQKSQAGGKAVLSSSFLDEERGDDDYESYEEEAVITSPPSKRKKNKL